jgi:nicotinate-nucleotide pyrophosphorylase (carboxylating)
MTVKQDFSQVQWDEQTADDCRQLVRLAVREELDRTFDWTTVALVGQGKPGRAAVVARQAGVVAGLRAAELALREMDIQANWSPHVEDGDTVAVGDTLAELAGSARDLLTSERLLLNLIGRLSGVATLTRRYVDAIASTGARIYDTRKTTPGWRRLEKYAVRCGGGTNHRTGLFDAVLIKDNHLAFAAEEAAGEKYTAAEAVLRARQFIREMLPGDPRAETMIIEVEVDTLEQLEEVLPAGPDIVLLDNMTPDQLRRAVSRRDAVNAEVQLEASGGVNLQTVLAVAETGVQRISVGALTHSATSFDVSLDWLS